MLQRVKNTIWFKKMRVLFNQGLSPRSLALSIALGVVLGIIPLFGIATPALTFIAIALRINLPIALFFCYAVSPLHVLLFIPFIKLGEWMLAIESTMLSFDAIKASFAHDFLLALKDLSFELAYGVMAWGICAIPITALLYLILLSCFTWYRNTRTVV